MKKGKDFDFGLTEKKSKKGNSSIVILGRIIFFLAFIGLLIGFVWSYKNLQETKKSIAALSSAKNISQEKKLTPDEENKIIQSIKKHIILPEDEKPVIAEIGNIEKLLETEPAFYKNAKNGDLVLIYEKNQKAFIYRQDADFIVNTGSVVIGDENTTVNTPKATTSITVPVTTENKK